MKNLLKLSSSILLILILASTCYSQDKITIKFDGKVYSKPYPKTYKESLEVINALVKHSNRFDSAFSAISKDVDSLNKRVFIYDSVTNKRLDSINVLLVSIDSLNTVIKKNNKVLVDTVKTLTDSINKQIDKIDTRMNDFNVGASVGLTTNKSGTKQNLRFSPVIAFRRIFGGLDIGTTIDSYERLTPFIGLNFGMFLR